eukprot:SAG11_NODE_7030_length_1205_cov_2.008137_1_plen_166_part_01
MYAITIDDNCKMFRQRNVSSLASEPQLRRHLFEAQRIADEAARVSAKLDALDTLQTAREHAAGPSGSDSPQRDRSSEPAAEDEVGGSASTLFDAKDSESRVARWIGDRRDSEAAATASPRQRPRTRRRARPIGGSSSSARERPSCDAVAVAAAADAAVAAVAAAAR